MDDSVYDYYDDDDSFAELGEHPSGFTSTDDNIFLDDLDTLQTEEVKNE